MPTGDDAETADSPGEATPAVPVVVRWVRRLSHLTGLLSVVGLILATLVTCHGVFTRYVLRGPTVWQTEATIYLLMFVTFVGAAYGLRHNSHVGVDLVVERLPLRGKLVLRIITASVATLVLGVILWTSFLSWHEAYLFDHRSATAWRFPLWIAYAILPVGMLCVILQMLAMIFEAVLGLRGKIDLSEVTLLGGTGEGGASPEPVIDGPAGPTRGTR